MSASEGLPAPGNALADPTPPDPAPDPAPGPPLTGADVKRIAERAASCPDVVALSGGPFGTVAAYLPGETVPGISVRETEIEIHATVRYGRPIPEIAAEIRDAVAPLTGGRHVNVTVDDVTGTEQPGR
ncbi:Asp23/Gls24 family envelope stress response protein [Microtetraspora glauca]|uniref:Asp23/Gls24 family envelope stress response protein n=1 Tax=Microtetraspora glauca TaxID=1996 RepID=A0ABV3GND3_MICGL